MNIKVKNSITGEWEIVGTGVGTGIAMTDSSDFQNTPNGDPVIDLEKAAIANRRDINMLKRDVKFIYENGTIGGGGGGGGGAFPKLSFAFEGNQVIVKTDSSFSIPFFFSSPNPGDGHAVFSITKRASLDPPIVELKKSIRQGRNTITFDPLKSGDYELTISATDNTGVSAQPLILNVIVGALEVTTPDESSRDVSISEDITIRYNVLSGIFKDNISVFITDIDGVVTERIVSPGSFTLNVGKITSLGVKTIKIKAIHESVESNELVFSFIVTDTSNMFMSSTFTGKNEFETDGCFNDNQVVSINYRISLLGAKFFKTDVYVNGVLHEGDGNIESVIGHNYFPFTPAKYGGIGSYTVEFRSRTLESHNPITGTLTVPAFEVKSANGKTYSIVKDSMILSLNATRGKTNNQSPEKRCVWEDTEPGMETVTRLHNFSFNHINGWVPKSDADPEVEALVFSGKTYAEIDLKPLATDLKNGFTFEIMYNVINDGHTEPNMCNYVLDLFDGEKETSGNITSGKGIFIDAERAFIRSSYSDSLESKFNDSEWIKQTFVINRAENEILIYTNGAISGYSKIASAADFLIDKKIIIGARRAPNGSIIDNAVCRVKTVRMYNRPLSDEEVFKNTVADLEVSEQDRIIEIHEGSLQIPTVKVKFNMSILQAPSDTTQCDFEYFDPRDPSKNQTLYNCIIQKQGTTSTTYPVSNYTITFYNGNQIYEWAPKDNWIPEEMYTLKADFMDSSHINNTGIAKFISHAFNSIKIDGKNGIKTPVQSVDPRAKDTIDGFMCRVEIYDTSPGSTTGYIYRGLYNFNTDRYGAKNYGLANPEFKTTAISYEAASNNAVCSFKSKEWNDIRGAFKVRYFKGQSSKDYMSFDPETQEFVMTRGIHNEFERLVTWTHDAGKASIDIDPGSENQFFNEFNEYYDTNYTVMYMLMIELFGLMDNLSKNMVLTAFKEEVHTETSSMITRWFPQLYDLDSSCGLTNTGVLKYEPCVNFYQEPGMPSDHVYNGGGVDGSILWRNVKKHFHYELKRFWAAMRNQGIITLENLMKYYAGETMDLVSPFLYSVDARLKYINPSQNGSSKDTYYYLVKGRRIEYTRKWLQERIVFLDSIYDYGGGETDVGGDCRKFIQARYLKSDPTLTQFKVRVKTKSPIFIHHVGDDLKLYGNKRHFISSNKYYEMTVPIESAGDGAFIGFTFGPNIRDIQFTGFDELQQVRITYYNLYWGHSINKIEILNNRDIDEIVVENCRSLKYFNVSGCSKLGIKSGTERLSFTNCDIIQHINLSGTSLGTFLLNDRGGILDTLVCDNSKISTFMLSNQHYISSLNINNCRLLNLFQIHNCGGLTSIKLPSTLLRTFRMTKCENISSLLITDNPNISTSIDASDIEQPKRPHFVVDACPKLSEIVLTNLTNEKFNYVDLVDCENLSIINLSNSKYLDRVRLSPNTPLSNLNLARTYITAIVCGRSDNQNKNFIDLKDYTSIKTIALHYCSKLLEVTNLNLGSPENTVNCTSLFEGCTSVRRVTGRIYPNNITSMFSYCSSITTLPMIHVHEIMHATSTFLGCEKLPIAAIQGVLRHATELRSLRHTFTSCKMFSGTRFTENFFQYNTKLEDLYETFSGCGFVGDFPHTALQSLTNLKSFSRVFLGCNMTVPVLGVDTMFRENIHLTNLSEAFFGMTFTRLPDKRFLATLTKLTNVFRLFASQTTMTKSVDSGDDFIHPDFFANNPNITSVAGLFDYCLSLYGSIPNGLFRNQTGITDITWMFKNCPIHGSIPENLFPVYVNANGNNESRLVKADEAFMATKLTGVIPESLFANHDNLVSMRKMFYGSTGLGSNLPAGIDSSFPVNFAKGKRGLKYINHMFQNCSNIRHTFTDVDSNMFSDNIILEDITNFLWGCSRVTGSIPSELLIRRTASGDIASSKLRHVSGAFAFCDLDGRVDKDIFKSLTEVESLASMFSGNARLEGGIHRELFMNCTKLKSVNSIFSGCTRLGTLRDMVDEDVAHEGIAKPFVIHQDIFSYNPHLEEVSGFIANTSFNGSVPTSIFRNNPKLWNLGGFIRGVSLAVVNLDAEMFTNNRYITNFEYMFSGVQQVNISSNWINREKHNLTVFTPTGTPILKNFGGAFWGTKTTGTTPKLWVEYNDANKLTNDGHSRKCFDTNSSDLANYSEIPEPWGGA